MDRKQIAARQFDAAINEIIDHHPIRRITRGVDCVSIQTADGWDLEITARSRSTPALAAAFTELIGQYVCSKKPDGPQPQALPRSSAVEVTRELERIVAGSKRRRS